MVKRYSDEYDLLPDAEAAARRGASRFAYLLSLLVLLFLVTFVLWARSAALEEVTRGNARVIPSSRVQIVQNLEGGIVERIFVQEGDVVAKGDTLLRIDNVSASTKYQEAHKRSLGVRATIARLEAELNGGLPEFPKELVAFSPDLVESQRILYEARKQQTDSHLSVLRAQAAQRRQETAELRSRLEQLQKSLLLTREEHAIAQPLVMKGLMARTDLLRIQQELNRLTGESRTLGLSIPRSEKATTEVEQRIEEVKSNSFAEVARELSEQRGTLQSLQEATAEGRDRIARTEVTSPVRGVIKSIKKSTIGGVIKPGEDIVEIVPLDDTLVVEAMIKPQDIAFLGPRQPAIVKITAYDFASYGGLKGAVEDISADTIEDERGERLFRVRVRTERASLKHNGKELPIIPGMTASVEILTGKKTILDYLLKPLRLVRDRALRER